jgi:hypothetical protein
LDTESIIKKTKEAIDDIHEDIKLGKSPDWYLMSEGDLEVVLDSYTYFTIPNIKFYMHKPTLRCLIELPDNKWVKIMIENHYNGPNKDMLRYLHGIYVQDSIRYDKECCFGLLIQDPRADSEYTICTLKAFSQNDFNVFAQYILDNVKPQKGMNLIDRFKFGGTETRGLK